MVKKKTKTNILMVNCQRIGIFNGVLLKNGNKARVYKYLMEFYKHLKIPKNIEGIPNSLKKNPLKIIDTALHQSAPFFIYKRIVKAGKLYEIPIPISKNRATFMASSWIRKVAQKKTSEGAPFSFFVVSEIINILKKKGAALEYLNTYTLDGLEKNIFKKYIRKKYPTVSRSKNINAYREMLARINKGSRKKSFKSKGKQSTYFLMYIHKKHNARNYQKRMLLKKKKKKKNYIHLLLIKNLLKNTTNIFLIIVKKNLLNKWIDFLQNH